MSSGAPPTEAGVTTAGQGSSPISGLVLLPSAPLEAAADPAPRGAGSQRSRMRAQHCLQRARPSHCEQACAPRWGPGRRGPAARGAADGHAQQWAVAALMTQEIHPGGIHQTRRGSDQQSGDSQEQRGHPHAHDSKERLEGLPGLRWPCGQGCPPRRSPTGQRALGTAPSPCHLASESQAVPAQLLGFSALNLEAYACVFAQFWTPFLSYRDISPW